MLTRRAQREPVQYVLGEWDFLDFSLKCRAPVLIPRPETEVLVEHILKVVMSTCDAISVLDHGQKISEGTPEHVKNDPAVVEAYLGREMADEDIRAAMDA